MKTSVKDEIAGYNMIIEDDVVAYPGDMVDDMYSGRQHMHIVVL